MIADLIKKEAIMTQDRAQVSLDPHKMFGFKQVARVSGGNTSAEMSKMLSKIGEPAGLSRLLSKIGEPAAPAALSRLLSKIGEPTVD